MARVSTPIMTDLHANKRLHLYQSWYNPSCKWSTVLAPIPEFLHTVFTLIIGLSVMPFLWPVWKWLQGDLEFADGGKSSTSCLKQLCLGQCHQELELCFGRKQLWLPCSFLKVSVECSKQPWLPSGQSDWIFGWKSFIQGSWNTREGSNSCHQGVK